MNVVIAGSRSIEQYGHLRAAVYIAGSKYGMIIKKVISGDCPKGVDQLGIRFATECKLPVGHFPADWKKNGIRAGYIRNGEMTVAADAGIILWDGVSKGTKHMIDAMRKKEKPLLVYRVDLVTSVKFGRRDIKIYSHVGTEYTSVASKPIKTMKPSPTNVLFA